MSDSSLRADQNATTFYLVTTSTELPRLIGEIWPEPEANLVIFKTPGEALERLLIDPPTLLITDLHLPNMTGVELLRVVKEENVYGQMPAMLYLESPEQLNDLEWSSLDVDDFLIAPLKRDILKARIELTLYRSSRTLDASPLTHLPGNTSIINTIKQRIEAKEDFALGYCDLDHFKSYNDKYGFARGDELLMMSARLIVTTVRSFRVKNAFVGHVGGDDFVFILPSEYAVLACEHIVESFDAIVTQFYDDKEREQNGIISVDRHGILRNFPFISMSIAVVINKDGNLEHYGQVSQIASSLKSQAKAMPGSQYIIDRRSLEK